MEWIETTGKTLEEAKQRALEELGIDEDELEYEVVQEPRGGLLGRLGSSSAHVRARVRPVSREKPDRRRGGGQRRRSRRGGSRDRGGDTKAREPRRDTGQEPRAAPKRRPGRDERERATGGRDGSEERAMSEVPIEEQARVAEEFTRGLVEAFGLDGTVEARAEDDRVFVEVDGDDLGLLIGPDGGTMDAVRELVKTALQRETAGHNARVAVDVAGYNAARREALEAFARELADKVRETGRAQALEPMTAPDRKVVHDAVNEVEGVTTVSEGDEPRRRVVITPDEG